MLKVKTDRGKTSEKYKIILYPCGVLLIVCFFFIANSPRFLSLDAHWSSDETRWLNRSEQFINAVEHNRFSDTAIAHHPGIMTMWITGVRTLLTYPQIDLLNLTLARWFIGIVISLGIGIICLLLYQLFGRWVALVSFACLAYSPLFLAQTRRVHTDALATVFILLTVLLLLLYCINRQRVGYLLLSGITFGLAVLSKSYALILFPWVPFCLLLFRYIPKGKHQTFFHTHCRIHQFSQLYVANGNCCLACFLDTCFWHHGTMSYRVGLCFTQINRK